MVREEVALAVRKLPQSDLDLEKLLTRHGFILHTKQMALNSERAAEYLGYRGGAQVLRTMKHQGTGPKVHKLGRLNIYFVHDLDEWLRMKAVPAN